MTLVLRVVNKNRWPTNIGNGLFSDDGDAPADTLLDFKPEGNTLSLWLVDDDFSNLERLLTALAASRDKLDKLDYIVASSEVLSQAGISVRESDGNLIDFTANKWHIDLVNLTARQVGDLVTYFYLSPNRITERRLPKAIMTSILAAVRGGTLTAEMMKNELRTAVADSLGGM